MASTGFSSIQVLILLHYYYIQQDVYASLNKQSQNWYNIQYE